MSLPLQWRPPPRPIRSPIPTSHHPERRRSRRAFPDEIVGDLIDSERISSTPAPTVILATGFDRFAVLDPESARRDENCGFEGSRPIHQPERPQTRRPLSTPEMISRAPSSRGRGRDCCCRCLAVPHIPRVASCRSRRRPVRAAAARSQRLPAMFPPSIRAMSWVSTPSPSTRRRPGPPA